MEKFYVRSPFPNLDLIKFLKTKVFFTFLSLGKHFNLPKSLRFLVIFLAFHIYSNVSAQEIYEDFNSATGWTLSNGTAVNRWRIGKPTNRGPYLGGNLAYVGDAIGTGSNVSNDYTKTSGSIVHSYKTFAIPSGTTNMFLTFNWRAYGEPGYDNLNVWIVPNSYTPTAGTAIAFGGGRLRLGPLNGISNFQNITTTPVDMSLFAGGSIKIILEWINNASAGIQPPAAIDDITLSKYCSPLMGYSQYLYFNQVSFVGTLNDVTNNSTYAQITGGYLGYQNFTRLPSKAVQAQGEGVNVSVQSNDLGRIKAWVDWNQDGNFAAAEEVYDTEANIATSSTIFGFVIPDSQTPGDYRIRIRTYRYDNIFGYEYDYDFDSCELFSSIWDEGETEDYLFTVIAKCNVKIATITDGQRCGAGNVNVSATGTTGTTLIRWYNAQIGGTLLGTSLSGANYTIIGAATSGEVWATAYNGTCENSNRKKVKYKIDPTPVISFSATAPDICGNQNTSVVVSAAADKETIKLIDEKFTNNLGTSKFENVSAGAINSDANWKVQKSSYVPTNPPYLLVRPAIASGFDLDRFACAISDVNPGAPTDMRLTLRNPESAALFTNLFLEYDLYYRTSGKGTAPSYEYANVDVSTDGGITWTTVKQYLTDYGIPNRFKHDKIDLTGYAGQTTLKIRFVTFSYAIVNGWMSDIMAIDNIELYGERPLAANFAWNAAGIDTFAADCVSPYSNGTSACFKPSNSQLENYDKWTVNASATLSNGCSASGTIEIINNTKIWNTASTDWNSANWKPATAVPTADKCVVIKTPVTLNILTNGLAKNVTVKSGGKLDIAGNLTVTDYVKNENANADNLTVKSDGNLIQINPTAPNSGSINAERDVTDMDNVSATQMDYVYWSAPVTGQQTKGPGGFSPGTPNNRFFRYNEPDDRFYETGDLTFVPGKGYAVQAETSQGFPPNAAGYSKTYHFRGTPNNGDISFNINRSPNAGAVEHGFNLIGNPYPSNIDFNVLYANNSALIYKTVYFWSNNTYTPNQEGNGYAGNNYAVYTGTGGNPPTGGSYATAPNGIIKVGQGVIIQKKAVGGPAPLVFKNSYGAGQDLRVNTSGTFYQKTGDETDRFWLQLISPEGTTNNQLIGYIEGATDNFEQDYDAEILGMSSDLFYSKVEDKKVLIQGKGDFVPADRVKLGANFFKNGLYTIALDHAEGIFSAGQNIYLKDIQTNTVTNLSEGPYVFSAEAGVSEGRFEIIYEPETVLATDGISTEDLIIYRDGGDFVAQAKTVKIKKVEVYDLGGRLIYSHNANDLRVIIPAEKLPNNVYILKITQNERVTNKKILK